MRLIATIILLTLLITPFSVESKEFGSDSIWDDGKAEVAIYKSKKRIYGKLWDHEAVLITVKEDFDKALYTKADYPLDSKDILPVLKLNYFTSIQTYNYPYHYLISVFVNREDVTFPVKMTVSSQEWCGNTFKEFINWKTPAELVYHSYFDKQGDGTAPVDFQPGDMLMEQLPLSLRALPFKEGFRKQFRLLDSQMTNKFSNPKWHDARLSVLGKEKIEVIGKKVNCWRVEVLGDFGRLYYWFDTSFPHTMMKYTDSNEQEMILEEISRTAYWEF